MNQNATEVDVQRKAEEIKHKTDLSGAEAAIVAGEKLGYDVDRLCDMIGYDRHSYNEKVSELHQRRLEVEDEIERLEETRDLLSGL